MDIAVRTEKQKHLYHVITILSLTRQSGRDEVMYHALMGIEPQQIHVLDLIAIVSDLKQETIKKILIERPEWRRDLLLCTVHRAIIRSSRHLLNFVLDNMTVDESLPTIVSAINMAYELLPPEYLKDSRHRRLVELYRGIQYTLKRSNKEWRDRRQEILNQVDGKLIAELAASELGIE